VCQVTTCPWPIQISVDYQWIPPYPSDALARALFHHYPDDRLETDRMRKALDSIPLFSAASGGLALTERQEQENSPKVLPSPQQSGSGSFGSAGTTLVDSSPYKIFYFDCRIFCSQPIPKRETEKKISTWRARGSRKESENGLQRTSRASSKGMCSKTFGSLCLINDSVSVIPVRTTYGTSSETILPQALYLCLLRQPGLRRL